MIRLFITLIVVCLSFGEVDAKSAVISFGGECEGGSIAVSAQLQNLIEKSVQQRSTVCSSGRCQGVFAYDLNNDGSKELFVRLGCGATGNCTWGVFSDSPARLRGVFTAWFIYVQPRAGSWSSITTYTREGGDRGVIARLLNKRGKYLQTTEHTEQGYYGNWQPFLKRMGVPKC